MPNQAKRRVSESLIALATIDYKASRWQASATALADAVKYDPENAHAREMLCNLRRRIDLLFRLAAGTEMDPETSRELAARYICTGFPASAHYVVIGGHVIECFALGDAGRVAAIHCVDSLDDQEMEIDRELLDCPPCRSRDVLVYRVDGNVAEVHRRAIEPDDRG